MAAIANRAAIKVFECNIEVYTTAFTYGEVLRYIPYFSERYGITIERMHKTLSKLPLVVKSPEYYESRLSEAKSLISDPDDIDVAALALHVDVPVWSNDNHFKGFPTGRYTTAELLRHLGI